MLWYVLIVILMSYPIAELSRLIHVYYFQIEAKPVLIWEFTLIWLMYLSGIIIMAWRLKRR